ncbi:MAG: futalosine hydrolase [Tenuifilaceae bacterium]
MKILIVAATASEVEFKVKHRKRKGVPVPLNEPFNHDVDLLVTGIGAVPTAFFTTRFIEQYQLVLNIGIAGSYSSKYPIGSVVCIKKDAFGDYGIDDRGKFKTLVENKLIDEDEAPFQGGVLLNKYLKGSLKPKKIPLVMGVTLATASGSEKIISQIKSLWGPDIETMESAAVFYVCNMLEVPFVCIRSISNMVEPRDKSKWEIKRAIVNLNLFTRNFINELPDNI